jgi:dolichyl-phosphate beta-glucosyltransferase
MSKTHLSVVIPAYNESVRLKKTLPIIIEFFKKQKYSFELVIVDDGSKDKTVATVKSIVGHKPFLKLISLDHNQGKGAALRAGIMAAVGTYVLFMDADLSTPLTEIDKFWPVITKYPIVIGSRKMKGAVVTKHQNLLRENLGKVFTFLTNTLATKNVSDITCGFKLFQTNVAHKLFGKSVLNDWSFDAEILFLAQKHGFKIKEVPVSWQNDPRTKVNLTKDSINALTGLLKIRLNDMQGKY